MIDKLPYNAVTLFFNPDYGNPLLQIALGFIDSPDCNGLRLVKFIGRAISKSLNRMVC
jgi:hypothetical protein